ncbi:MAG TPA: SET domain-containing protein-lysine N-methyltransferase [Verrucomicrobiae bacterium]|nr:SET domain-containing protein-lysine N-methyltransferase [Verrucomicrobiae bacterium]
MLELKPVALLAAIFRESLMKKQYPQESWWIDGLKLSASAIDRTGVFSSRFIREGTVVIRWGGIVFTGSEMREGKACQHTYVGIDDDLFLANPAAQPPGLDDFMNHSCDGNLWMEDDTTLIARRDIMADEELTSDYALWLNLPEYRMKTPCNCHSPLCRHTITGLDWRIPEVQKRYFGHFSPFINKLILKNS